MASDSEQRTAKAQSSARLLSTVGAGVAGIGLGVVLAGAINRLGVPLLVIGLVAHLVGMVGNWRIEMAGDYHPAAWERLAYWGCWLLIFLLLLWLVATNLL